MDNCVPPEFDLDHNNRSDDSLEKWRNAVGKLVKNRRRRFRYAADLEKRSEAKEQLKKLGEKIRSSFITLTEALPFLNGAVVRTAGFKFDPDKLASLVASYDIKTLTELKGVDGLADGLEVSLEKGVNSSEVGRRQNVYGVNHYTKKPSKHFWVSVREALRDVKLIILMVCAVVSIGVGVATEGWPKVTDDALVSILSILLVVMVTAISHYKQSSQFKELDNERSKIFIYVTRDRVRKKVSINDLVVGDIVILSIGDDVPADGIFVSGINLWIDQLRLNDESVPICMNKRRPFLLAGTKVVDGCGKMLVTAVGPRTELGKLMATVTESRDDKPDSVDKIIGKIGLCFGLLTFLVLTVRFLIEKGTRGEMSQWGFNDALLLLSKCATAVTISVVAVPKQLLDSKRNIWKLYKRGSHAA